MPTAARCPMAAWLREHFRHSTDLTDLADDALRACGATRPRRRPAPTRPARPITGTTLGGVDRHHDVDQAGRAGPTTAFRAWRTTPGPLRGELVRRFATLLRTHKADLARLVQLEAGKIESEALGEVQEMIDICDFAVGLSRQLHGLTIASERPGHRLMEQWHPLGPTGVITAFNFPVAVWSWNAALALVCGNPVIWKPSELTPLTALATQRAVRAGGRRGRTRRPPEPGACSATPSVGAELVAAHGRAARQRHRLDRDGSQGGAGGGRAASAAASSSSAATTRRSSHPSADIELVVRGVTFAAAGTAGQRCTIAAPADRAPLAPRRGGRADRRPRSRTLPIGSPLDAGTLVGPLITHDRVRPDAGRARHGAGRRRHGRGRRRAACSPTRHPTRRTCARPSSTMPGADRHRRHRDVRPDAVRAWPTTTSTRRSRCRTACRRAWPAASSPPTCARPSGSAPPTAATAASPTSTSAPAAPRSAGRSAARRPPAAAARAAATRGRRYMRRATNTINYSNDLPLAQGVQFG